MPWVLKGPLNGGTLVIGNEHHPLMVWINEFPNPQQQRAVGDLLVRSEARDAVLEHMLTELTGDDDGSRHQDLIQMLKDELAHTIAWRLQRANNEPAPQDRTLDERLRRIQQRADARLKAQADNVGGMASTDARPGEDTGAGPGSS
jgi:hypothetical protein